MRLRLLLGAARESGSVLRVGSNERDSVIDFVSVYRFPVVIETRSHPIPSRTRKLSLSSPMVLHGRPCGRVGRRRIFFRTPARKSGGSLFPLSRSLPFGESRAGFQHNAG